MILWSTRSGGRAFGDVCGEGLWLAPPNAKESMIVLPDADQTPEEIAGFDDKIIDGLPNRA